MGRWQGVANIEGMEVRAEIELRPDAAGGWSGHADFRDTAVLGFPVQANVIDRSVTVSTASGVLIEGRVRDDASYSSASSCTLRPARASCEF